MTVRAGGKVITGIRAQGKTITRVRAQGRDVWTASVLTDLFDREDGTLGPDWVLETKSGSYEIGIHAQGARFGIPDGLLGLTTKDATHRFVKAQSVSADGYLETQIAHKGSYDHSTRVYRRYANTGGASGVGFDFRDSRAYITKRVGNANTLVLDLSSFVVGDVFRMRQVGNLHSAWKNGEFVGEVTISDAPSGTGNRSLGLRMEGSKDLLGPRRFSPQLNYIMAS